MKKDLFFVLSIILSLSACQSDDEPTLSVSKDSYTSSATGETISMDINSNTSWTATSDQEWCVPSTANGEGDYSLPLRIAENKVTSARNATVTLGFSGGTVPISIVQEAAAATLSLSSSDYNVAYNDNSLVVPITSNTNWTVTSNQSWCSPMTTSGSGDKDLVIDLVGNTTSSARSATLTFTVGNKTVTTTVDQAAISGTDYHYKIPIIFHVLYRDATDSLQYVKKGWINTLVASVNELYSKNNMNMEFELATHDTNGNILSEPGVDREQISVSSIDCDQFMDGRTMNNSTYLKMVWDLDKYLNVFVYEFKEDNSGYTTMGITDLPYVNSNYKLDGLSSGEYYLTHSFSYPQCSSINSNYIYEVSDSKYYNPMDVVVTMAHEFGHYFGLFHVFTETDEKTCAGTDYCDDTPNYDRNTYETWLEELFKKNTDNLSLADVAVRTSCDDGSSFTARNIMDYEYCYSDKFTTNQRERVRYILNYGLFIPGPKYATVSTSSRSVINATRPAVIYKSVGANNELVGKFKRTLK